MDSSVKIDVLVPTWNCSDWIDRCLQSIFAQTRQPNRVLVIDDASTDFVYSETVSRLCLQYQYMLLRNTYNQKCPYNLQLGIKVLDSDPNTVIFLLDGDDFLQYDYTFARIAELYQDPNLWLTYGNYEPFPYDTGQVRASAYPDEIIARRAFREDRHGRFNHPLTFRKHLWDQLRPADLQNDRGDWFRSGYDLVIMMPMLEMAVDHFRFLNENLYGYNAVNPFSESHTRQLEALEESRQILNRPPREKL